MLTTSRCTMTTLTESDFHEAINLFTNEQVRKYLGGVIEEKQAYDKLQKWEKTAEDLYLCVRCRLTNVFIGIVSVNHSDCCSKTLSYQFMPKWWGKGIAEETLHALLEHITPLSDAVEILAETQSINIRSCKLLEKLGFVFQQTVIRFGAEQNVYKITLLQTSNDARRMCGTAEQEKADDYVRISVHTKDLQPKAN